MKSINVTTWDLRAAEADLDDRDRYLASPTGIFVRIQNPGESDDPAALKLTIQIRNGPGSRGFLTEVSADLRAPDFRSLVAVLETAIGTAEKIGILNVL